MATLLSIIGFALLIMETLTGLVANGSIVLINCIDWFRNRKLSPTDLIMICLGSSRLMWQALVMLHVTMFFFFLRIYILKNVSSIIMIMWFFTDMANLWFVACLGVWYLTKIAIFSHPVFHQVKQRFSGLLPWLLLGSVVCSALMTIIAYIGTFFVSGICDPYKLLLNNSGDSEIKYPPSCMELAISVVVLNAFPSAIFLASTILLIISLWRHSRHLQHNGTGVWDVNTSVHLRAIKALASFTILYLFSFLAMNLKTILIGRSTHRSWTSVFFFNVSTVCPSGHAVILILINPKLKQAWIRMIHRLKCRVSEALF